MPDNYRQIVDLQSKKKESRLRSPELLRDETSLRSPELQRDEVRLRSSELLREEPVFAKTIIKKKSRSEAIDQVYNDDSGDNVRKELGQIDKPSAKNEMGIYFKQTLIVLLVIAVATSAYLFFKNKKEEQAINTNDASATKQIGKWYSVQLASQETYYGYIKDISADPIVLENVYYNYSQVPQSGEVKTEEKNTASIRLVKRGKEAHGPDGTMDIVRSQVLYMEPLSEESKILKAILDYEK